MANSFQTLELCRVAKHDGRQLSPVNHGDTCLVCSQNILTKEFNHAIKRSATRFDNLPADLVDIDDPCVVVSEQGCHCRLARTNTTA
jgi:hypothetical protein